MGITSCLSNLQISGDLTKDSADAIQKKLEAFKKKRGLTDSPQDLEVVRSFLAEKKQEAYKQIMSARKYIDLKKKISGQEASNNLGALLEHDYTGKYAYDDVTPSDVWTLSKTYQGYYSKDLMGFMEKFRSKVPGGLDFKSKARLEDIKMLVDGIYGNPVKSNEIADMAKAFSSANRAMAVELKRLGAAVHLDNNWMPQNWDPVAVQKAGEKAFVEHFSSALDMARTHDGFSDEAAFKVYLSETYKDIVTNGLHTAVKTDSATVTHAKGAGSSSLFGERSFQFKDSEAFMTSHEKFGQGDIFENMIKSIDSASRELALVRTFGPNYNNVFAKLNNIAKLEALSHPLSTADKISSAIVSNENLFRYLTGNTLGPRDTLGHKIGQFATALRALKLGASLGSSVLASINDFATSKVAADLVGSSFAGTMKHYAKLVAGNQMSRNQAAAMGQVIDSIVTGSMSAAKLADDNVNTQFSKFAHRTSEAVIRASGLARHTQSVKNAFQTSLHVEYAAHANLELSQLPIAQQKWLKLNGLESKDWDILRAAVDPSGTFIDPAKVSNFATVEKWMSSVNAATRLAIPEPAAWAHVSLGAANSPGTFAKEVRASLMQLWSYNISTTHVQAQVLRNNILLSTKGSKLGYIAAYVAYGTLFSAVSLQLKSLSSGKDIQSINDPMLWLKSSLNTLGLPGDVSLRLLDSSSKSDLAQSFAGALPGYAFSVLMQAKQLGVHIGDRSATSMQVKHDTFMLGKTIIEGIAPGNNLWYTKLAVDRLLKDNLQKATDPMAAEVFQRSAMKQRQRTGQDNWWKRGESAPSRLPEVSSPPSK
jgi:hypothetical protein